MKESKCKYRNRSNDGAVKCENDDMNCYICGRKHGVLFPAQKDCKGFEEKEEEKDGTK